MAYATWSTRNETVAKNGTVVFKGETNAAHPDETLSLFAGVNRGAEYGEWKVIVQRKGKYLGYDAVGAAGEIKISGQIDPEDSWWYHVDDLKGL